MIDIKLLRENPDLFRENIKKKFQNEKLILIDKILSLDDEWKKLKFREDNLRANRNKISQTISELKKQGKDSKKELEMAKKIPGEIAEMEAKRKDLEGEIKILLMTVPNLMDPKVPIGKDASQNVEVKKIGKPRTFSFPPKNHIELGEGLGILDFDSSADVAGKGFYYLKGELAVLNQALINFARDYMVKRGFVYVETPLMIRKEIVDGVVSFGELDSMIYKIDGEDLYLIGTSEHSLIGQFIGKTLTGKELPILQTAYSMCFRREVGSHGIEEKGLFRTHQFNKQEMIVICEPSESEKWFDKIAEFTVDVFSKLEIPTRVLEMCSGDLGDLKNRQIDIEVWSPIKNEYYEVGSCSNLTDAQARRLNIKIDKGGERYFAHTLNNTVIATSRALVAIMENNQQKDGSIKIPKVLWKYTGFNEIKSKNKPLEKVSKNEEKMLPPPPLDIKEKKILKIKNANKPFRKVSKSEHAKKKKSGKKAKPKRRKK